MTTPAPELFAVRCLTCSARLKVRNLAAIGQILACPKCGGMVQIAPPAGWQPPADAVASSGVPAAIRDPSSRSPASDPTVVERMPRPAPADDVTSAALPAAPNPDPAIAKSAGSPADSRELSPPAPPSAVVPPPVMPSLGAASTVAASSWTAWLPWAIVPLAGLASSVCVLWLMGSAPTDQDATSVAIVDSPTEIAAEPLPVATDSSSVTAEPVTLSRVEPVVTTQAQAVDAGPPAMTPTLNVLPETLPTVPPSSEPPLAEMAPVPPEPLTTKPIVAGPPLVKQPVEPVPPLVSIPVAPPAATAPPRQRPPVDVTARFAQSLPALNFKDQPLEEVVEFFGQLSGVPVTIDDEALRAGHVDVQTKLTFQATNTTVGRAFTDALSRARLVWFAGDGQVVVTSRQRAPRP